jgi:hypothetical protein
MTPYSVEKIVIYISEKPVASISQDINGKVSEVY